MKFLKKLEKGYSPKEKMPLASYALLTVTFNALLGMLLKDESANPSPEIPARELVLAGLATHKLSRFITKDAVTSFIRAPLTRYKEPLGYGELNEESRREGFPGAVGEAVSCSYCMSAWVGLGVFWGLKKYPRQTRLVNRLFSVVAVSDFLHVFYEENRTRENVLTLEEDRLDRSA